MASSNYLMPVVNPTAATANEEQHDQLQTTDESPSEAPAERRLGRRKINIEYIEDKGKRHITFSKRRSGIMKKAFELSTLTGTQVLLVVASETGHVYTFATRKLKPLITQDEGKNLIQTCLNAPENVEESAEDARSDEYATDAPPLPFQFPFPWADRRPSLSALSAPPPPAASPPVLDEN